MSIQCDLLVILFEWQLNVKEKKIHHHFDLPHLTILLAWQCAHAALEMNPKTNNVLISLR